MVNRGNFRAAQIPIFESRSVYTVISEYSKNDPYNKDKEIMNEQIQDQIKSIDNRLLHMMRYLWPGQ